MRSLPFYFLLLLFSNQVYSQIITFPTDSAEWKYYYTDIFYPCPQYTQVTTIKTDGDTTINGLEYTRLNQVYGYLRVDSNQVFFLPKDSIQEYLIYDFNLEVGDTFIATWSYFQAQQDTMVINQIDSILISNEYRKVWTIGNTDNWGQWIEGIGSSTELVNILYQNMASTERRKIICFKQYDEIVYEDSETCFTGAFPDPYPVYTYDCDGVTVIISSTEEIEKQAWQISPNPFMDQLQISGGELGQIESIGLFNSHGGFLQALPIEPTINLDHLPDGLYVIQLQIKGQTQAFRVVKSGK